MKGEGLTIEERIERGRRAKELLHGDVFREALDAAKMEYVNRWLAAEKPDPRLADLAWAAFHVADAFDQDLRRIISDHDIAAAASRR